jgi:hypothetical protein
MKRGTVSGNGTKMQKFSRFDLVAVIAIPSAIVCFFAILYGAIWLAVKAIKVL